jgi:RNA polymerase sigma-70 factor (ECF subfamily)
MKYLKDQDASKDAVMEIFEDLLEKLKKHHVTNFKSWLHSVARNHCLMTLRKEGSEDRKMEEFKNDPVTNVESEQELHLNDDTGGETEVNRLREGLGFLKEEQKQCVELFYFEEQSYQQIAEATGFTMKEVKSYLQNGKRNLKNYLLNGNE